jgi:hypothetical protein
MAHQIDPSTPDFDAVHAWVDALQGLEKPGLESPVTIEGRLLRQIILERNQDLAKQTVPPEVQESGWLQFEAMAAQRGFFAGSVGRGQKAANAAMYSITAVFFVAMMAVGMWISAPTVDDVSLGETYFRGAGSAQRMVVSVAKLERVMSELVKVLDQAGVRHVEKRWVGGAQVLAEVPQDVSLRLSESLSSLGIYVPANGQLNVVFEIIP